MFLFQKTLSRKEIDELRREAKSLYPDLVSHFIFTYITLQLLLSFQSIVIPSWMNVCPLSALTYFLYEVIDIYHNEVLTGVGGGGMHPSTSVSGFVRVMWPVPSSFVPKINLRWHMQTVDFATPNRCWTGDKPLPEPMLTQFTDAYMRH